MKFHSKWPTLTARHGHALQRTVTNSTALVRHHFMTVLTNLEADAINSLGGVRSNTRRKSEHFSKWPPRVKMKKLKFPTSGGVWSMGPRGFSVGHGTLYVPTKFHTYWWNVAQGLVFKVPVGGATKNRNTNFGMWARGTSLHVSCEFHIHNYYGVRRVIDPPLAAMLFFKST